ncbi:MAG TPA: hypothetical protein VKQ08_10500 [Cyclobacteriaceae bacterium]|nr:hypothetical protein [Cyclobacteriaceae bacterium]
MHISDDLRQYVAANPHIGKVYFDKAGNHHFNVHEHQGKFYSRLFEEAREDYEICEILSREQILEQELGELIEDRHHREHQRTKLVLTTSLNNFKFTFMALQLNQGQFSLDTLQLIDTDTGLPVKASFANVLPFGSDNPAILTSVTSTTDPTSTVDTAVSAGTANVTGGADVTYTDSKTNQPVTKTLVLKIPYTVVAVVAGENVALSLVQGTPRTTVAAKV